MELRLPAGATSRLVGETSSLEQYSANLGKLSAESAPPDVSSPLKPDAPATTCSAAPAIIHWRSVTYTTGDPLVAVVGPTGSGKSELAIQIARQFRGEVVNCDSLQIYRHFDIGTAKVSAPERQGVLHHMIDIADPDEPFTAGEYIRRVRLLLVEIVRRNKLPVVVGGTGFYLRALLNGLFPGPGREATLRARLSKRESRRPGALHRLLRRLDPDSAARIHPNDIQKLVRAVEVCLLTRRSLSEAFAAGREPLLGFRLLKIGLNPPRQALYERLDRRCRKMFESGLVDEVRRILTLGYSPEVKPLESHGYRQALQFLQGELTLEQALYYAQRNIRRYAKRQVTWFRQEPGIVWLSGFGDAPDVQAKASARVREHLLLSR